MMKCLIINTITSPPSRAAWIEIGIGILGLFLDLVAAFTGGVD